MKLSAIGLDYDGTAARDGVLDPGVRAVVAENGGVIEFADSGYTTATVADANDAEGILRIIRRLELPLTLAFIAAV